MKASAYRFAAAAALCLAALLASEQDRVTTLRTAAALIDHGDLGQAAAALQQLLAHSADDPLALNLLGVVRMREGRPREAEQLFLHAAENGPQFPGPHVNLAELYGAARWREALQQLHEALKLSPGHQQASAVLRRITKEAASDALKAGDGSGALSVIEEARQIAPDDAAILYEAGLVETQLKSYAPAEKALRQVLHLDPAYADAMYALARTCLSDNRAADAESWMREYLKVRPNDATALYGLGYILMSEQKTGDARAAFEASLKMRPEQTESLFKIG
jgi:Flp pilus assembly protein TadD